MKHITNKSEKILHIEEKFNESIEELLRKLYVDENHSIHTLARELGITYVSAYKWLNRAGIYSHKLASLEEGGNDINVGYAERTN